MRIAILADFPVHKLPVLGLDEPAGHYATWFPPLAEAFESCSEHEIHWVTITRRSFDPAGPGARLGNGRLLRLRGIALRVSDSHLGAGHPQPLNPASAHAPAGMDSERV